MDKRYKNPIKHTDKVGISIAGIGGTGSILATQVVRLDLAMRSLGHPGFEITLFDPDKVTHANVGRQLFTEGEVGANKAEAMAYKLRRSFLCEVNPRARKIEDAGYYHKKDILIACVDTKEARKNVKEMASPYKILFDCGNTNNKGQVLMNSLGCSSFYDEFPELLEGEEDNTPSCSLAEALSKQELYINSAVANACSQMLWGMFRHGGLDYRGVFINLDGTQEVRTWN